MKKERIRLLLGVIVLAIMFSCKKDDTPDGPKSVPARDKKVVYSEDIKAIEDYLKTHTFNYEDFDFKNPYAASNDGFKIVFSKIDAKKTPTKKPLMDFVTIKTVKDSGIDYKLYVLKLREGKGDNLNLFDEVVVGYEGMLLDSTIFDSSSSFKTNLISVVTPDGVVSGVVKGFKEGLLEFKVASSYAENEDGSISYKNDGMGAIFVPSGLGYFSVKRNKIPSYTPLVFSINTYGKTYSDYDKDMIPSYIENPKEEEGNYVDTDGDSVPDIVDADDDNDGIKTNKEVSIEYLEGASIEDVKNKAKNLPKNKMLLNIVKLKEGKFEGKLLVFKDENKNGVYDHLDKNYPEEQ